jgi:5-bromo-4-chloroindolyl phosphate hydrolysis protein
MTETKPFYLSKKEYQKIILNRRLKKSWWLYLLMFILGAFHLQRFGEDSFSTFFTIFAFAYPFLTFSYLYFWSGSKGHNPIFQETKLTFDTDYLYFERNGNESKVNPNTIQKVISNHAYWMLYISKAQFIYIPKNIFHSNEDCEKFSNIINPK